MKIISRQLEVLLGGVLILLLNTAAAFAQCVQPPANLISWWPGDGDANDIVGPNNGTLQNGATFAPGMVGQAFSFDGIDDLVEVADSPSLSFNTNSPLSLDLWAFRTGTNQVMHLIGKRVDCGVDSNYQMALNTESGEGLVFGAGFGLEVATGIDLPLNTWTHLAGTFDGTTYRFYINGQLVATSEGRLGERNTAPLLIGGSGSCTTFAGLIDEVEVFDRALSAEEVSAIFHAGSAGKCKPVDTTPPSCAAIGGGTNALGQRVTKISCQDTGSGLASIRRTKSSNYTVKIPAFDVGTTNPVVVIATKIDNALSAWVTLKLSDVAGNVGFFDPVDVQIDRKTGKPLTFTSTGIPQAESQISIYNGNPGLTTLYLAVNGTKLMVAGLRDNEVRNINVSAAMVAGDNNTISFQARGRPGGSATILIHD